MCVRIGFLLLGIALSLGALSRAFASAWEPLPVARNVIVLIPDGGSQSLVTLARWARGTPLAVDPIQSGAVQTSAADLPISGRAAAATAMACGVKTAQGQIGMSPPPDSPFSPTPPPAPPLQPVASILEAARASGRSVGLVSAGDICGAIPAAFAAHVASCESTDEIAEQLVAQELDVVFGQGKEHFLPASAGGQRRDDRDLLRALAAQGVRLSDNSESARSPIPCRTWALTPSGKPNPSSAPGMTAQALALLDKNRRGFLLVVDCGLADQAARNNDAGAAVRQFLAFDDAVRVARSFADNEGRGRTLVIACPAHDTGGLSIGRDGRTPRTLEDLTGPLAGPPVSAEELAGKIGADRTPATIMAHVQAWWNIRLTEAEADEIAKRVSSGLSLPAALGRTVSSTHTVFGWASRDSTGVDVPLWSYGPGRPTGVIDNVEIGQSVARAMRVNLADLTKSLFVDARQAFANAALDETDPVHPVLTIGAARLPVNQNLLILNGQQTRFSGVVVHVQKTGRTYLPRQAVDLIRSNGK
jgi:alkaline phosphatase